MTDEQNILLSLVKLMFPREMLDYFEVVGLRYMKTVSMYVLTSVIVFIKRDPVIHM